MKIQCAIFYTNHKSHTEYTILDTAVNRAATFLYSDINKVCGYEVLISRLNLNSAVECVLKRRKKILLLYC